jgi:hypothetical protein
MGILSRKIAFNGNSHEISSPKQQKRSGRGIPAEKPVFSVRFISFRSAGENTFNERPRSPEYVQKNCSFHIDIILINEYIHS